MNCGNTLSRQLAYASERCADVLEEDRSIASFPIPVTAENITIIPIADVLER